MGLIPSLPQGTQLTKVQQNMHMPVQLSAKNGEKGGGKVRKGVKTTPCHFPNSEKPPKYSFYTQKTLGNLWERVQVFAGIQSFAMCAHGVNGIPLDRYP